MNRKSHSPGEETRKTINVLALALLLVFLIFQVRAALWLALLLLLAMALESRLTVFLHQGWMAFSALLGKITSRLIMGAIFYLALTPLSFFYRLGNRKITAYFLQPDQESFFVPVLKPYAKSRFEKMW